MRGQGGGRFLLKIPGVGSPSGWGRGGGGERPGGCLWEIGGGGGLNFYFRGRNSHQVRKVIFLSRQKSFLGNAICGPNGLSPANVSRSP